MVVRVARFYVGVRLPPDVVAALDMAAQARDCSRTAVIEQWLAERATAEGWLTPDEEGQDDGANG